MRTMRACRSTKRRLRRAHTFPFPAPRRQACACWLWGCGWQVFGAQQPNTDMYTTSQQLIVASNCDAGRCASGLAFGSAGQQAMPAYNATLGSGTHVDDDGLPAGGDINLLC